MSWLFQPLAPAAAQQQAASSYMLTADAGSFALSGQASGLLRAALLGAGAGSFALSGQAAGLLRAALLGAGAGSFALSGQAAGLIYISPSVLTAETGNFALSGQDAGLLRLGAGTGSFALSGQAAGLLHVLGLTADAGSYTLSVQDATLFFAAGMSIPLAVQRAIYELLTAALPAVPVYDHVPHARAMPFIVLMSQDVEPDDGAGQPNYRHTIELRAWSNYRGQKEVLEILGSMWSALHNADLTLSTGDAALCQCVTQTSRLDEDGLTRFGDLTVNVVTAP